MLKIFFHRKSRVVLASELVGLALFVIIWLNGVSIPFIIYTVCYLFIRFCASWNWKSGVNLHFEKALVPTAYIIMLTNILFLTGLFKGFVFVALFLFAAIIYLNVILVYLHFKDCVE